MYATSTMNIQSKTGGFNGVEKHANRGYETDSNINIDYSKTKYNLSGQQSKKDNVLNKVLNSYIKQHDAKPSNKYRKYNDAKGYLKNKTRLVPDKNFVSTFGSKELKEQILNKVPDDKKNEVYASFSKGLAKYAHGFNKRNHNFTLSKWITNVDELGAPHIHMQVIPHSKTAKGKPSFNTNKAVTEQFNVKDNRVGLSMLRKQEDSALVRLVGEQLRHDFPKEFGHEHFLLERTGQKNSVDMNTYRESKLKAENDANVEIKKQHNQLVHENLKLTNKNNELKKSNEHERLILENENSDLKKNNANLKSSIIMLEAKQKRLEQRIKSFYEYIAHGYSALGVNYHNKDNSFTDEHGTSYNYLVAMGKMASNGLSGFENLYHLIKRATKDNLERFKQYSDSYVQQQSGTKEHYSRKHEDGPEL